MPPAIRLYRQPLPQQARLARHKPQCFALLADRDHPVAAFARQINHARRIFVISPHHGSTIGCQYVGKQPHFGGEVIRHVAVIIQVIAAQVRECCRLHRQAFGAILRQAVA